MSNYDRYKDLAAASMRDLLPSGQDWWRGVCQICEAKTGKPDRRGSFSFNPVMGKWQCFKCASWGYVDDEKAEAHRAEQEARVRLSGTQERKLSGKPEGFEELGRGDGRTADCFREARRFLKKRVPDIGVWKHMKLGATLDGYFAERIIVPLLTKEREWVGFVARTWDADVKDKYLYPKGMERILYNEEVLDVPGESPLFVVEGAFDALHFYPDAVAVLGKAKRSHLLQLAKVDRPLAICLDGDAWMEGEQMMLELSALGHTRVCNLRLPPKVDPDEIPRDELEESARNALGLGKG